MMIAELTAVTTADLTESAGLSCWEAATHGAGPTRPCQTQAAASARTRSDARLTTNRLPPQSRAGRSANT